MPDGTSSPSFVRTLYAGRNELSWAIKAVGGWPPR
jgi:hypothetical protein